MAERRSRRIWPFVVASVAVVLLVPAGILALPILLHVNQGLAGDVTLDGGATATATGDDGRTRTLSIEGPSDAALTPGDHVIVTGSGYDASRGIYVAICVIPRSPSMKPGPCIGGASGGEGDAVEGAAQYAPSNWINDDWAWKLFGARPYDDPDAGSFTAYLEVGDPVGDGFDCTKDACAVYTRNDHTAASDRVQDLYVPVSFAPASAP